MRLATHIQHDHGNLNVCACAQNQQLGSVVRVYMSHAAETRNPLLIQPGQGSAHLICAGIVTFQIAQITAWRMFLQTFQLGANLYLEPIPSC